MISIILIVAIFVLLMVSGFIIANLNRKLEASEEFVEKQSQYITKFSETVAYCHIRLNQIDEKGTFESDDEVGWFFGEVKEMGELLNQYNTETINND